MNMRGLSLVLPLVLHLASAGKPEEQYKPQKPSPSSSSGSSGSSGTVIHTDPHLPAHEDSRLHPTHTEYNDCKYDGDWGDCDPFKMVRIKTLQLVSGGVACVDKKNISKACTREDFPPGTVWLLKQHKQCVLELQKLKSMIEDLHRYIDLIHQRGQSLFNAYNELRKHLFDIRREISNLGRLTHAAEQTVIRLTKEVKEWKMKSNKMQMELNQLKGQYKQLEVVVKEERATLDQCQKSKEENMAEQARLSQKLYDIKSENRDLKSKLLNAERYKEELREHMEHIAIFKGKIADVNRDITKTKNDLNQCKIDGLQTTARIGGKPKINKDTKVNLDMNMWITHNITQEQGEAKYYKPIQYGPDPSHYPTPAPEPKAYSKEPEVYSKEPEVYSEAPEVYSKAPEVYSKAPEVYSEAPEVYVPQVNKEPEVYEPPKKAY